MSRVVRTLTVASVAAFAVCAAAPRAQARADELVFAFSAASLDACDGAHPSLSLAVRNASPLATAAMATAPMTLAVRAAGYAGTIAVPEIAPGASQTISIPLEGEPIAADALATINVLGARNGSPTATLEIAGIALQRRLCPSLGHPPAAATKPQTK